MAKYVINQFLTLLHTSSWFDATGYKICFSQCPPQNNIQSTLVISKSKGPFETLRDIRTSTYQMCSIEENTNGTIKFHK